jgi:hypothetical protein
MLVLGMDNDLEIYIVLGTTATRQIRRAQSKGLETNEVNTEKGWRERTSIRRLPAKSEELKAKGS